VYIIVNEIPAIMSSSKKTTPEKYFSIKQAAVYLGENTQTVKGWRRRGLFPNARLTDTARGPVWEIPISDLESFERPKPGRPKSATARSRKNR
jgi:hypothetical protein